MPRLEISTAAADDIRSITLYIARDDPALAHRVRRDLLAAARRVAAMPRIGRPRPDLTDEDVRFWIVRGYRVVYRLEPSCVFVVGVFRATRDIDRALDERLDELA